LFIKNSTVRLDSVISLTKNGATKQQGFYEDDSGKDEGDGVRHWGMGRPDALTPALSQREGG
jgi:hypothetical protein